MVSEDADKLSERVKRSPERTRRERRTEPWTRDTLARSRTATTLCSALHKLPPFLFPSFHSLPRPAARDAQAEETRRPSGLIKNSEGLFEMTTPSCHADPVSGNSPTSETVLFYVDKRRRILPFDLTTLRPGCSGQQNERVFWASAVASR